MIYIHLDGGGAAGAAGGGSDVSFELIDNAEAKPEQRAVAGLGGGLLRSRSSFPYFFLVALEAGSPLRALLLLVSLPLVWLLGLVLHPDEASVRVFTFVSMAGLPASAVQCVARAVLPKAILDDVHPRAYKLLTSCSSRFVVTSTPAVLVEHFVTRYLGAELLAAPELQVTRSGLCTGFLLQPIVVDKARAIRDRFGGDGYPEVGIGDAEWDHEFLSLCKRAYVVGKGAGRRASRLPKSDYLAPLIFHDGRLVHRPTPLWALTLLLWLPIGIVLALLRIFVALCLPKRLALPISHLLGVSLRVSGVPPGGGGKGVLFVLPHRTLVDPVFLSFALGRDVATVTYSLSRLSELLSPIRTVRLTRRREQDAARMEWLLRQGPLAVCPEGTTCREPYLLRFSPLFAEMSDRITPVALTETTPVFYATSARGWKFLDGVFFLMNPVAFYTVRFLPPLPRHMTCTGGSHASADVANHVQRVIASSLGYTCTSLTRRDKYQALAGNDGTVPDSTCSPLP